MANVILPMTLSWLTLGGTINLLTYYTGNRYRAESIFNESDFTQNPVDILNSTYYVLQDQKLPYSAMGLPIDLVVREKRDSYGYSSSGLPKILTESIPDRVVFLTVTEYKMVELSVKDNASPIPGWQESVPKTQTHYADKMYYGGRCISMYQITTEIPGDVQVVRRIITDVMGSSGAIGENTHDLWEKAMKAVKESSDVRGYTYFKGFSVNSQNIFFPIEAQWGLEGLLKALPNVRNFTSPYNKEKQPVAISTSYKPLHGLDNEYPALEKNKVSEEYLVSLDEMLDDLTLTFEKLISAFLLSEDPIIENFSETVEELSEKIRKLSDSGISIYKDLQKEEFEDAFKRYEAGLQKAGRNYYSVFKKLVEDLAMVCDPSFVKPTSGILETSEEEVRNIFLVKGGLEECKQFCRSNTRCRAIGYLDIFPQRCRIYYRSTNTANILSSGKSSPMKIYDRKCQMEEE